MYNYIFSEKGIPWHYQTIKVATKAEFNLLCDSFRQFDEFHGMSISMPFKSIVYTIFSDARPCYDLPFLANAKSCNTIVKQGSSIFSYSTDVAIFKAFLDKYNLSNYSIFIYGTGSMAVLSSTYFSGLGFNVTTIPRNSISNYTEIMHSGLDCAFINCTPAYIEDLFLCNVPEIPILDLPIRRNATSLSNEYYMSGIDATLHQFRYQLMLYTDLCLPITQIRSIYEKYSH